MLPVFRPSLFICKRRLSGLHISMGGYNNRMREHIRADIVKCANGDPLPMEYYFSNLVSFWYITKPICLNWLFFLLTQQVKFGFGS